MKIIIEVSAADHARLKAIARDKAVSTVEALVSRQVDYLLYLNRDRAAKRKMARTCSKCKALNDPEIVPGAERARAHCERCGKKLTAKGDPFVPGSISRLGWAIGEMFKRAEAAKVAP